MSAVMPDLITKQEVAEALHCSIRHVERLLKEGLPFIPVGERKKLYSLTSVLNWIKSRESCLSEKTKKAAGTPKFASTVNAYTEYCQRAQQRRKPTGKRRNSGNN
jgi:phage terminase Nu1 subunit (DNA packaging protein)